MKYIFLFMVFLPFNSFASIKPIKEAICAPTNEVNPSRENKYSLLVNVIESVDTNKIVGLGDLRAIVYSHGKMDRRIKPLSRKIEDIDEYRKLVTYYGDQFVLQIEVRKLGMMYEDSKLKMTLKSGKRASKDLLCRVFRPILKIKW